MSTCVPMGRHAASVRSRDTVAEYGCAASSRVRSLPQTHRMHDLAARDSPLEYWFWKVMTPAGGAIVDFVVRRETGTAEVRVSTWRPGVYPVIHESSAESSGGAEGIRIGESHLDASGSAGSAGDVRWEVRWDLGAIRLAPRPDWFGPLHPFDMELVARPHAHLRGLLRLGPRTIKLDGAGVVAHYWGRRLPDRWTWISASGFDDDPDARLEALLVSSRLWGGPLHVPAGYVWISEGGHVEETVEPLTGAITLTRHGHGVRLGSLRADGRRHTIECSAPPDTFNDVGDGVEQSLSADLSLDGRVRVTGSVGLEFRG